MNFVSRYKKLIIICLLLVLTVFIFVFVFTSFNIESFLKKRGFSKYDDIMYYIQLSTLNKSQFEQEANNNTSAEYDYLYFGLGNNHLIEEIGVYNNEVDLEYTGEYSYKSRKVMYSMRGEYNKTVVQFSGTYDFNKRKFTCEPLLHYDITYDDELKSSICELVEYHSINLYNTSVKLIDNKTMLKKIIKNTQD